MVWHFSTSVPCCCFLLASDALPPGSISVCRVALGEGLLQSGVCYRSSLPREDLKDVLHLDELVPAPHAGPTVVNLTSSDEDEDGATAGLENEEVPGVSASLCQLSVKHQKELNRHFKAVEQSVEPLLGLFV